jgi:predicted PurR-regulated permease PerM
VGFDIINWTWEWVPAVVFGAPLLLSVFISLVFLPYTYFCILKEMIKIPGRIRNVFRRK